MNKYARFYALMGRLPIHDEELKERLVAQYTQGRTTSLRCMTAAEYTAMCNALDNSLKDAWSEKREQLRKCRSVALRCMQRLGIDTTDWTRINAFCRDPRIAGVEFASLSIEALEALTTKLRSIERRGGLRPVKQPEPSRVQQVIYVPVSAAGPLN
nr:MAG TPA: Protein of unknown function (DUF1018) [Caudoviricetes sp.]